MGRGSHPPPPLPASSTAVLPSGTQVHPVRGKTRLLLLLPPTHTREVVGMVSAASATAPVPPPHNSPILGVGGWQGAQWACTYQDADLGGASTNHPCPYLNSSPPALPCPPPLSFLPAGKGGGRWLPRGGESGQPLCHWRHLLTRRLSRLHWSFTGSGQGSSQAGSAVASPPPPRTGLQLFTISSTAPSAHSGGEQLWVLQVANSSRKGKASGVAQQAADWQSKVLCTQRSQYAAALFPSEGQGF